MSEQTTEPLTETEIKAAQMAYRDRCAGAMQDAMPFIEGLYLRGFTLAVCLVPVDNAGPILPLWTLGGAETINPDPDMPESSASVAEDSAPLPENRVADHLKPNGVNRGNKR